MKRILIIEPDERPALSEVHRADIVIRHTAPGCATITKHPLAAHGEVSGDAIGEIVRDLINAAPPKPLRAVGAETTFPNTPLTDKEPEVMHSVTLDDGTERRVLAADPPHAIEKINRALAQGVRA